MNITSNHNIDDVVSESVSPNIRLYHGSNIQGLKTLVPKAESINDTIGNVPKVFATDDKRFAACFGATWHDDIARQGTWDNWETVVMGISDMVDMNSPCSLYELENDGSFIKLNNKEYISDKPIKIKKEIRYKTFREMLEDNGVYVIPLNLYKKCVNAHINPITITESYSGNLPMISDEWLNKYVDKVNRLKNATNSECYMRLSFTDNLTPYQKLMPIERRFKFPDISNLIREDTYLAGDFHFTKYDDAHDVSNIKRINALPKNATLIVLGDVGYMKNLDPNQKDIIRDYFSMCTFENMYLVLGNHDVYPVDFYLSLGFKGVYENITVPNKKWILSHQAMDGISDKYINFHAHNHGTYKYSSYLRKIDNKIDCWEGFCPNKFKTIREWILFNKASHFKKVFKDE